MKRLAVVAVVVLAVTACKPGPDTTTPTRPATAPKPPAALDVYRECVKSKPTDRAHQSACQVKAWGDKFSDDDSRWSCLVMGDLKCGPAERKA